MQRASRAANRLQRAISATDEISLSNNCNDSLGKVQQQSDVGYLCLCNSAECNLHVFIAREHCPDLFSLMAPMAPTESSSRRQWRLLQPGGRRRPLFRS